MSIATAIASAQGKVASAYDACDNKGATMPTLANQNLSNLASTILSIPTDSGNMVVANPSVPSGITPAILTGLQVDNDYYTIPVTTLSTVQPQGGFEPNIVYDLGTITGNITFALASPTDNTIPNPYHWTFETGSTAPTITWPNGLTWAGGSAPTIGASKHYEVLVRNGYASALEFQAMVTMLDNWLTLRMMSAPSGGSSNIVYELYGHTCDGTAATAINTGIYLFDNTVFPYGWTIELDFYFTAYVSQGSVIRCRNAGSPYNGINTRNRSSASQMEAQVNGVSAMLNISMGDRIKVFFDYTLPSNVCTVTVNNITNGTTSSNSNSMSGKTVTPPLVVGGENNTDAANFTWKSGRFPKCYITSLVVTKKTS